MAISNCRIQLYPSLYPSALRAPQTICPITYKRQKCVTITTLNTVSSAYGIRHCCKSDPPPKSPASAGDFGRLRLQGGVFGMTLFTIPCARKRTIFARKRRDHALVSSRHSRSRNHSHNRSHHSRNHNRHSRSRSHSRDDEARCR